jgi:3',5'-cyclic AMP phosphodiesterase CpdA
MEVLAAVVTDMRDQAPTHVAMTGDILNIGLPGEFPLAEAWLMTLGEPGQDVSFVAGNHDAYTRGSLPTLARTFAPWTKSDSSGTPGYPYLKIRDGIALIGLCSGVPRAPFIASGRLGLSQRETCERLLKETGAQNLTRIVMLHHPPRISDPGGHIGRGLSDHQAFAQMIGRVGAELIIHGHNHKLYIDHIKGPTKPVPVVGVPSASAVKGNPRNRAGYHLFSIVGTGADAKIVARARGLLPGERQIGDLGVLSL